jgi:membrane carboxypeptidase/penicillin-binding protein
VAVPRGRYRDDWRDAWGAGCSAQVAAVSWGGGDGGARRAGPGRPAATAAAPHWTLVSTPDTSTTADNELSGLSCPNTSFCMAVGYYFSGTANRTRVQTIARH